MQLIFVPKIVRAFGANFKQSFSATFTALTVIATGAAFAFNFANAQSKLGIAFDPLKKAFGDSFIFEGLNKLVNTFHNWGSLIIGTKDAFKQWVATYLNPSGFKAGVIKLYQKLKDWVDIVYTWFKDKFWEFIKNIPEMVKNWDKLRLSLFKWGTFLGGGGGSALWANLGIGANLGKLGDLMNHPKLGEMMENFNTLMQDNSKAFEDLGVDGIKEIIEEYLDNPDEANKVVEELIEKQKQRKEKDKEEQKELQEFNAEEIMEQFKPSKAGNPPDKGAVLNAMVTDGLKKLLQAPSSGFSFDASYSSKAKKGMQEYLDRLKEDIEKRPKKSNIKLQFQTAIKGKEEQFLSGLADAAEQAFQWFEREDEEPKEEEDKRLAKLRQRFIDALTKPCNGNDCNADSLVKALSGKDD